MTRSAAKAVALFASQVLRWFRREPFRPGNPQNDNCQHNCREAVEMSAFSISPVCDTDGTVCRLLSALQPAFRIPHSFATRWGSVSLPLGRKNYR